MKCLGFFMLLFGFLQSPIVADGSGEAVAHDSPAIVGWADGVEVFRPGPVDITDPDSVVVSFGEIANVLGPADAFPENPVQVLSLGDGGTITLRFDPPIANGPGADFAVFENGFADGFMELAFVEVSADGNDFVRFPSLSRTPTEVQVPSFGWLVPEDVDQLAGRDRAGLGTPFDLADLAAEHPSLEDGIRFVRIVDVVGSIQPEIGSRDSTGRLINDPFPTPFPSGGFDLDAVAVLHQGSGHSAAPVWVSQTDITLEGQTLTIQWPPAGVARPSLVLEQSGNLRDWVEAVRFEMTTAVDIRTENLSLISHSGTTRTLLSFVSQGSGFFRLRERAHTP